MTTVPPPAPHAPRAYLVIRGTFIDAYEVISKRKPRRGRTLSADSREDRILHAELLGNHYDLKSCSRMMLKAELREALLVAGRPPRLCFVGEKDKEWGGTRRHSFILSLRIGRREKRWVHVHSVWTTVNEDKWCTRMCLWMPLFAIILWPVVLFCFQKKMSLRVRLKTWHHNFRKLYKRISSAVFYMVAHWQLFCVQWAAHSHSLLLRQKRKEGDTGRNSGGYPLVLSLHGMHIRPST